MVIETSHHKSFRIKTRVIYSSTLFTVQQKSYLEVPQLWKRVDDDTEDDVQADGRDEDKEGQVKDNQETELHEGVLGRMAAQVLCINDVIGIQ